MRDTIAIHRGLVLVPPGEPGNAEQTTLAASLQAELMNLGFMLDAETFAAACRAPREWLLAFYGNVIPDLRKRVGAGRDYRPMYANFPREVMETDNLTLFINAVVHYLSDGHWEPPQTLRDRGFAFENVQFRVLRLGTEEDLKRLFTKLASLNQSLTEQDKAALDWLIDTYGHELVLPDVIPFKETLCILAAKGLDVPVKTPTDVLRVAVFLSGGDVSLPGVPKPKLKEPQPGILRQFFVHLQAAHEEARKQFRFRKFNRRERRLILGLLEKTNVDPAEMQRYLGRWLRLGEILHVGEFAKRFPRSAESFRVLRNQRRGERVRTFYGRVDLAFKEDWRRGADLLATRPGEFARKLDWMLRKFDQAYVLDTFDRVGADISSKVLIELYNHFQSRSKSGAPRAVMLKGRGSKMKTLPSLPAMEPESVGRVRERIISIMRARIGKLPPLGKVWIDERLKHVPVPFAMRSVNTAVRTYVRGTRVPFRGDARVIRPFLHWYDEAGDQDMDLSVGLYDEALKLVSHISFTNLKETLLNCCHSGDIRHRVGPSAEYVDIDIQQCLSRGVRYAVVHAFNYNARPMHTVKDCVFGLMERERAEANAIFVPKTISNCMPLANESTSVVVCVIDLRDGVYVWADVEADRVLPMLENAANKTAGIFTALLKGSRMSVYELLSLQAQARGQQVNSAVDADLVLRWDDFVTDYSAVGSYMSF